MVFLKTNIAKRREVVSLFLYELPVFTQGSTTIRAQHRRFETGSRAQTTARGAINVGASGPHTRQAHQSTLQQYWVVVTYAKLGAQSGAWKLEAADESSGKCCHVTCFYKKLENVSCEYDRLNG